MKSLNEYLELSEKAHGHLCAGQVLNVQLAILELHELNINDPVAERKQLMTYVKINRYVTDTVAIITNCQLSKHALKFRN